MINVHGNEIIGYMTTDLLTSLDPARIAPLTDHQMMALTYDLNPDRIDKLKGMSYLTQQDIRATLTTIFGFGGFSYNIMQQSLQREEQVQQVSDKSKTNWSVTWFTRMRLEIPQLGAFFEEGALGNNKQPDYMEASDMALKTSASDALKRCAINLGTAFGLSLYNNGSTASITPKSLAPHSLWPRADRATVALKQMIESTTATPESLAEAERLYPEPAPGVNEAQHKANLHLVARGIQHRWNLELAAKPAEETTEEQPAVQQ